MFTIKRLSICFAVLLHITIISNVATAAGTVVNSTLQSLQGKINLIDTSHNTLVIDDMAYTIGRYVVVKTVSGKDGRIGLLYPGKHVRIEVEYTVGDKKPGVIHTIYILK